VKALAALLMVCGALNAQPLPAPVKLTAPVQDKNFWLLSLLERAAAASDAVKNDPALARLAAERAAALDKASKTCALDLACYAAAFEWSDAQASEAGHALGELYRSSPAVRSLADGELRQSGMYVRYAKLTGDAFLERAWTESVHGINRMIDVYELGKAPRYPAIDSITYDVKGDAFRQVIRNLAAVMEEDRASMKFFFSPALRFALEAMWLNHRDEAGRYEPMESGENAAAFAQAKRTDWSRYPYSAIVAPGAGNDRPGVRLSASGKLRDEIVAKRFREGKAPFVIVSGGHVHPSQTEYAEAIEMKRDLMTRFGIPASAIIVDPHARHTTTNMRNAARLMYRYGFPFEMKALVSTDPSQSAYIEGKTFEQRCLDELGYVPYRLHGRTSLFDLEFVPLVESLQADPLDPLDP
jgi:hypothetical protein